MASCIFVFETTHHALWAEEIVREQGLPFQVTVPPAAAHARCDIALETFPEERYAIAAALAAAGIEFRIFDPHGNEINSA